MKARSEDGPSFTTSIDDATITTEGFSINLEDLHGSDFFVNWMVLPEFDDVWINHGRHVFENISDTEIARKSITFLGHEADPDVRCWFSGLSAVKSKKPQLPPLNIAVRVENITNSGFDLVLRTPSGTARMKKVVVDWLSHTKPNGTSNARFLSGQCSILKDQKTYSDKLDVSMIKNPTARFLAFNEIRVGSGHKPVSIASSFREGTDGKRVEIEAGPLDGCECDVIGLTWIMSV